MYRSCSSVIQELALPAFAFCEIQVLQLGIKNSPKLTCKTKQWSSPGNATTSHSFHRMYFYLPALQRIRIGTRAKSTTPGHPAKVQAKFPAATIHSGKEVKKYGTAEPPQNLPISAAKNTIVGQGIIRARKSRSHVNAEPCLSA